MTFPIVALGASAGGLEAVSEFLAALPARSEMAYVVVQHLDPNHKSLLPEIWSKRTALPVLSIHDGALIEPEHVYEQRVGIALSVGGIAGILAQTPVRLKAYRYWFRV